MKRGPRNKKPNLLLDVEPKFKDEGCYFRLAVEKPKIAHPHITNEETLEERIKELASHLYLLEYIFTGIPKLEDVVAEWKYQLFDKMEEILKHIVMTRTGEERYPVLAGYFEEDRQVLQEILDERPLVDTSRNIKFDGTDSDFFYACSEKLDAEVDRVRQTGYNLYYTLIEFERGLNVG